MKRIFILAPLILLFWVLLLLPVVAVKAKTETDGTICGYVITKGGKIERGVYGGKNGYVIVGNKTVAGRVLKQNAWLRRIGHGYREEFAGIYYLLNVWQEGNSTMIEVRYRNHSYRAYELYDIKYWRVVKN